MSKVGNLNSTGLITGASRNEEHDRERYLILAERVKGRKKAINTIKFLGWPKVCYSCRICYSMCEYRIVAKCSISCFSDDILNMPLVDS